MIMQWPDMATGFPYPCGDDRQSPVEISDGVFAARSTLADRHTAAIGSHGHNRHVYQHQGAPFSILLNHAVEWGREGTSESGDAGEATPIPPLSFGDLFAPTTGEFPLSSVSKRLQHHQTSRTAGQPPRHGHKPSTRP